MSPLEGLREFQARNPGLETQFIGNPVEARTRPVLGAAAKCNLSTIPEGAHNWFRSRGFAIRIDLPILPLRRVSQLFVSELARRDVAGPLYHATSKLHLESIRTRGLMTGALAGVSTTRCPGSELWIQVTTDRHAALSWVASGGLLAPDIPPSEWTLLQLAPAAADDGFFQHPVCDTGRLLGASFVRPELISLLSQASGLESRGSNV